MATRNLPTSIALCPISIILSMVNCGYRVLAADPHSKHIWHLLFIFIYPLQTTKKKYWNINLPILADCISTNRMRVPAIKNMIAVIFGCWRTFHKFPILMSYQQNAAKLISRNNKWMISICRHVSWPPLACVSTTKLVNIQFLFGDTAIINVIYVNLYVW